MSFHRPLSACLCAAGLLALLTGCSGSGNSVEAAPPSPEGAAARQCRALHDALPGRLDGRTSRKTDPVSDLTAAWGDPAMVLRCGVPLPEVLTPGNEHYNPTTQAVVVNDVDWLPEEQDGGGYVFTTVGRSANVQLRVPGRYHPHETDPLVDLARAVKKAVPARS